MNDHDDDDALGAHLRAAMHAQADQIKPTDRLGAILGAASASAPVRRSRMPYLVAAVLVLIVGVAGTATLLRDNGVSQSTAAGAPEATMAADTRETENSQLPPAQSPNPTTATVAPSVTAPSLAYYVVAGVDAQKWSLTLVDLEPDDYDAEDLVNWVLAGRLPGASAAPYPNSQQPWQPETSATVTRDARISIVLNKPLRSDLTAEQQRIAVMSLVWTATDVIGHEFEVEVSVAETPQSAYAWTGTYRRPPVGQESADLAPLWVSSPTPGEQVADSELVVYGEACVSAPAVSWQLLQGQSVVIGGTAVVDSVCPERGVYNVALPRLTAGAYRFRAFVTDPADGSLIAEAFSDFQVTP